MKLTKIDTLLELNPLDYFALVKGDKYFLLGQYINKYIKRNLRKGHHTSNYQEDTFFAIIKILYKNPEVEISSINSYNSYRNEKLKNVNELLFVQPKNIMLNLKSPSYKFLLNHSEIISEIIRIKNAVEKQFVEKSIFVDSLIERRDK